MKKRAERHGVWVVDKPVGPTSHDVVWRARRALGERAIGHAGTLDPMASGVLVLLVGEATKLAPYLTADDKRYVTRVRFGVGTDTFDALGREVARAAPSQALLAELAAARGGDVSGSLAAALDAERARTLQVPPAHSAVHVDGKRSYELARAGVEADLPPRPVVVRNLAIASSLPAFTADAGPEDDALDVSLWVGKGYYVRAFARDLGAALGVPTHLTALRRVASGAFDLEGANSLERLGEATPIAVADAAARALGSATLTEQGVARARCGQPVAPDDFASPPANGAPCAWLDAAGELVAIGAPEGDGYRVVRGFG